MSKKKINVDLDGTVVNFLDGLTSRLHDFGYRAHDLTSYHLLDIFKPQTLTRFNFGLWCNRFDDCILDLVVSPSFWEFLEAYPFAVNAVKALSIKYDVSIVSCPWHSAVEMSTRGKKRWCENHFPGIETHFDCEKKYYPADYFIDDYPASLEGWEGLCDGKALIVNRPYNDSSTGWIEIMKELGFELTNDIFIERTEK